MNSSRSQARAELAQRNTGTVKSNNDDVIMSAMEFNMNAVMKIAQDLLSNVPASDEKTIQSIVSNSESNILKILQTQLVYIKTAETVNQVVKELEPEEDPEEATSQFAKKVNNIEETVNARLATYEATLTESILRSHPKFLKLQSQLIAHAMAPMCDKEVNENVFEAECLENGENCSQQEIIPDIDPISKQPLKDPVRNAHCRHIYGKATMLQLIQANPKTRCPAMGCGNTTYVKASHLIEDPVLTARMHPQRLPGQVAKPSSTRADAC